MTTPLITRVLIAEALTPETFQPFGQVISATVDGKPFDEADAQLVLDQGIPRFYIMRLEPNGFTFSRMTQHHRCTQCLGSLASREWYLGVAPPSEPEELDPAQIKAFRIPGTCFVKLHVGTWHAGPLFEQDPINFYNLELSDTNVVDHHTVNLASQHQLNFQISPNSSSPESDNGRHTHTQ